MTGPSSAGDVPPPPARFAADRLLAAATTLWLILAPASGSAGLRGAMLVISCAALLLWRGRQLASDLREIAAPIRILGFAWAALAAISLAWSVAPRYSLGELQGEVAYGLVTFVVFFLAARHLGRWRLWWGGLVAGTLLVFILSTAQDVLGLRISRHPMDGGPGPWSTHLVLIAPLLLAIAWPRPWGFERGTPLKAAALLLLLVAATQTDNRIIWAAFAAQLAVMVVISGSMPAMGPDRIAMLRRLSIFAAVAVMIGFAASVLERNERFFRHDPSVTASIDRDIRPKLWSVARTEFLKAPWLGHGFGREILAEKFLVATPGGNHPPMRHSHNAFSDIALQLGAVGLAIFVGLIAALALEYRRYLRDERLAPLGIIGLAVIAGYLVKNLTDDFFYRHNALVFWAVTAMLLGLGRRRSGAGAPATGIRAPSA